MKKSILRVLVLALTMVFVFAGCSKESKTNEKKENAGKNKVSVNISTKEEVNGNVKIKYPQIEKENDKNIGAINDSVKFFVKDKLNTIYEENPDISADIDYKVSFKSDEKISFLFTGTVKLSEQETESFIHGITVGLKEGRMLTISDVTPFDEEFPKTVKAGKVTTISGEGVEEAQKTLQKLDDMSIIEGIIGNKSVYSFHLTENMIVISFPVSEELGGYAFSEIEFQKDYELVPQ